MLYKKGDINDPENYRPTALINTIFKIFTQFIHGRCKKRCVLNDLFQEFQSGFRKGKSCLDNIFTLNDLVQVRLVKKGGKLFCLFFDFKRTFPSVDDGLL